MRNIFNASNLLGGLSLLSMIAAVGFTEGGNIVMAIISMVAFPVCCYLSAKEDGKIK